MRINIGCGATPTEGWRNFDNSPTVRLARVPLLADALKALRLLNPEQAVFAEVARRKDIRWAQAQRLPLPDHSVEVAYTSHMVEHLDRDQAVEFLTEMKRVLRPGGILRICVPDLEASARDYLDHGDADKFVASTYLSSGRPRGLLGTIRFLRSIYRSHAWMYDRRSLVNLLVGNGFVDAVALPPGQTTIPDPGDLDLAERASESLYVEARTPSV